MLIDDILHIINQHPEGIWIRELARKCGASPATICNYLYGYKNNKGNFVKPVLDKYVDTQKLGNGALTIIKPKQHNQQTNTNNTGTKGGLFG